MIFIRLYFEKLIMVGGLGASFLAVNTALFSTATGLNLIFNSALGPILLILMLFLAGRLAIEDLE